MIENRTIDARPRAHLVRRKYLARTPDKLLVDLMDLPTVHFSGRGRSPPFFNARRCTIWRFPIATCFGSFHHGWFSIGSIADLTADATGNQQRFDHGSISVSPARPMTRAVMTEIEVQPRNLKKIGDGSLLPVAKGCHDDILRKCFGKHLYRGCGSLQQALCNGVYRFMTESARAVFARPSDNWHRPGRAKHGDKYRAAKDGCGVGHLRDAFGVIIREAKAARSQSASLNARRSSSRLTLSIFVVESRMQHIGGIAGRLCL